MSIYNPQHKAIYLSPNRLDLLHRRRGISAHIHYTMFPARSQYAEGKGQDCCKVATCVMLSEAKHLAMQRETLRFAQGDSFGDARRKIARLSMDNATAVGKNWVTNKVSLQ